MSWILRLHFYRVNRRPSFSDLLRNEQDAESGYDILPL
jgi:hypothetical protein